VGAIVDDQSGAYGRCALTVLDRMRRKKQAQI
jgi:hypothetical protein